MHCQVDFGGLAREPHNITVVNLLVLSSTAITDFAYTPYGDTTSTTSAPSAQDTLTPTSRTTLLPQSTPTPANTQSNSKASKAGLNGGAPATYGQEPKEQGFTPHDPSTPGYTGHSPQFPDPAANAAPIVTLPVSNSLRTDGAMPYGSSAPFFVAEGRDTLGPGHDQRRLSIGPSPSSMSYPHPGSPLAQPVAPISQYSDQIQQQRQYRPDSFVTRPTSGPSQVDLVQQLVHTGYQQWRW
ncbi:hypothetical protein FRB95_012233 [Tulasnella sp. JGI-2019a]|nr:hypothetical protein FRB95_012233 [Tulasnella sp. JGI-2019a]